MRETYPDLKALFDEADAPLADAAFTDAVIADVRQLRWRRRAVLFGFGGLGAALTATQLPQLFAQFAPVSTAIAEASNSATRVALASDTGTLKSLAAAQPLWLLAGLAFVLIAAVSGALERA